MKTFKKWLVGAGVLIMATSLLIWFLPARLAMLWVGPQLHGLRLQQVDGELWDGRAGQLITADGQVLGRLSWQLSRLALIGQPTLRFNLDGPSLAAAGTLRKLPANKVEWRGVRVRVDLSLLDAYIKLSQAQPRGELTVTVDQALLQAGWPLHLQADAQWSNAALHTRDGDVAMGTLQLQAQAQSGVISAQLDDDGQGPLDTHGQVQVSPLGWRLAATAAARHDEPALRRWLAAFGHADASGTIHIQRSAGMAMGLPATNPDRTRE